jgi:hypothetical protein
MPDETINYKVNVDTSSLADQLQQIKNQVDQAMATYTFSATLPDPTPRAYAFPSQGFTAQIAGIGAEAGGLALDTGQNVAGGMTGAMQQARSFIDTARLGFQKFTNDVQNVMLTTSAGLDSVMPRPQFSPGTEYRPNFSQMGPFRSGFESLTGWGYNPNMSMTPGRYREYALNNMSDQVVELGKGALEMGAMATGVGGAVAGALGATGLAAAGLTLAVPAAAAYLGSEAFLATGGYDVRPALQARAFVRDASWRFLSGRFNDQAASEIGMQVATAARSENLVGMRMTQGEAMGIVQQAIDTGGFDTVRTADEFKQRAKTYIESTKYVMQQLGTTMNEAVGFMKDWMNQGLVTDTQSARTFSTGQAAMAYRAGYTPNELHAFGMQSAEMVRGTGIMMGAGYLSGQMALSGVKAGMTAGAFTPEMINQMGGAENAAATINRMGFAFGMSTPGLTYFAARDLMGEGAGAMDPRSAIGAATTRIRTLQDYMNFRGGQARMSSQVGSEVLFGTQVGQYMNMFKMTGQELNEDSWRTFMEAQGVGGSEADLMFGRIREAQLNVGATRMRDAMGEATRRANQGRPDVFSVALDKVDQVAAEVFRTREIGQAATDAANWISRTGRDISRGWQALTVVGYQAPTELGEVTTAPAAIRAVMAQRAGEFGVRPGMTPEQILALPLTTGTTPMTQQMGAVAAGINQTFQSEETGKFLDTRRQVNAAIEAMQGSKLATDLRTSTAVLEGKDFNVNMQTAIREWETLPEEQKRVIGNVDRFTILRTGLDKTSVQSGARDIIKGWASFRPGVGTQSRWEDIQKRGTALEAAISKDYQYIKSSAESHDMWGNKTTTYEYGNSLKEGLELVEGVAPDQSRLIAGVSEYNKYMQLPGGKEALLGLYADRYKAKLGITYQEAQQKAEAFIPELAKTAGRADVQTFMGEALVSKMLGVQDPGMREQLGKTLGISGPLTEGNIIGAFFAAEAKGKLPALLKEVEAQVPLSGEVATKSVTTKQQWDMMAAAKQVDVDLKSVARSMNIDLTSSTPQDVQNQVSNKLLITELRKLTNVMGNRSGPALPVYITGGR